MTPSNLKPNLISPSSLDETWSIGATLLSPRRQPDTRIRQHQPIPRPAIPEDNAAIVTALCLISQLYRNIRTSHSFQSPSIQHLALAVLALSLAPPTHVELL
jgi:hypothetical protein